MTSCPTLLALALITSAALGGCAMPPEQTSSAGVAITGGTPTGGWDSVVLVEVPGWACSGVLVAPDVVLTVGHCLDGAQGLATVRWCNSCYGPDDTWDVRTSSEYGAHPDYSADTLRYDIGVLVLDGEASSQPLPINRDEPDPSWLGDDHPLTYVGFGTTAVDLDDAGIKREASISVEDWDEQYLHHDDPLHNACRGDSGGPALTDHAGDWRVAWIIAIADADCGADGWDMRVDVVQDWVDAHTGGWTPGDDDTGDDDSGDDDTADDDTGDDDDDLTPPGDDDTTDDPPADCACSASAAPPGSAAAVLLLALAGRIRRHRRDA